MQCSHEAHFGFQYFELLTLQRYQKYSGGASQLGGECRTATLPHHRETSREELSLNRWHENLASSSLAYRTLWQFADKSAGKGLRNLSNFGNPELNFPGTVLIVDMVNIQERLNDPGSDREVDVLWDST